ncbi:MAG: hypothetical protein HKN41_07220 [Ilumatobacter sp.]|nr:hypothetical protein [Ilumatobacter sp.]
MDLDANLLSVPLADRIEAGPVPATVFHYSEDGAIDRFTPHVPDSNPSHPAAVWAIDAEHSPLSWFPRDCPRISAWATDDRQREVLRREFATDADRICAAESGWLDRVRRAHVFRYSFDGEQFARWAEAEGQYISGDVVHPIAVDELDDLLALHAAAEVDLRFIPKLGTLMDRMLASGLPFSFVRIRDARR